MASIGEKYDETGEASYEPMLKATQIDTTELSDAGSHNDETDDLPPQLSTTQRLVEQYWLFEIFALAMSTLGLLAVVVILRKTENKTVPTWSLQQPGWSIHIKKVEPVTITINSVISLFSTLVKSTILIPVVAAIEELKWLWFKKERHLTDLQLFSSASKGPLGALNMLWSLRAKTLSCLGALVVIGSLTLDFSFQQLVTYPLRQTVVTGSPALVARTNGYSATRPGELVLLDSAEPLMMAAMYEGLYSNDREFPVSPVCASGNCTWNEQYTSLGVCSRCYSTTDQLKRSCSTFNLTTTEDEGQRPSISDPIPYCNYTLPGHAATAPEDMQSIAGYWSNGTGVNPVTVSVSNGIASNETYFANGLVAHLAWFSVMRASWTSVYDNDSDDSKFLYDRLDQVNSTECGIDICVIKYQSSVNGTKFSERVIDTFVNETDFGNDVVGEFPIPRIVPPSQWTNMSNDNDYNMFTIDPKTSGAIRNSMGSILLAVQGTFVEVNDTSRSSSDFVSYIRYTDDDGLKRMMRSLAQSMTQRMRQAPGDGAFQGPGFNAIGVTWQQLPHVNVRWAWIFVPTSLVVLSFIFLLATLTTVRRQGANMLWKGNSLAYFYHPLTRDGRDLLRGASSAKHADVIAEGMKVKWTETETDGRFVITS